MGLLAAATSGPAWHINWACPTPAGRFERPLSAVSFQLSAKNQGPRRDHTHIGCALRTMLFSCIEPLYESVGQAPSPAHGQPVVAVLHFTGEDDGATFSCFVVSVRK